MEARARERETETLGKRESERKREKRERVNSDKDLSVVYLHREDLPKLLKKFLLTVNENGKVSSDEGGKLQRETDGVTADSCCLRERATVRLMRLSGTERASMTISPVQQQQQEEEKEADGNSSVFALANSDLRPLFQRTFFE